MATTLVSALIQGHKVTLANLGDSRAYLIMNKKDILLLWSDVSKAI